MPGGAGIAPLLLKGDKRGQDRQDVVRLTLRFRLNIVTRHPIGIRRGHAESDVITAMPG
jgi:hypothetical protein